MASTNFSIHPDIVETFPEAEVAAFRVFIPDSARLTPKIEELAEAALAAKTELATIDPITSLPQIAAWREAYGRMNVKPSKFHSSIEALLRRVKKGGELGTGLPIVDFYNLMSVSHRAPIGAYDAAKLNGTGITLRKSDPDKDIFNPLGGSPQAFPLNPELVIYGRGDEVLCWGFNTRDSSTVCVDENTTEVLFFSEVVSATLKKPEVVIGSMAEILTAHSIEVGMVEVFNADRPTGLV